MGNRVKGRAKKKSIKAALSSTAGSRRKLSRMGKRQKKEHGGLEASFVGRAKCIKMLQVTIKDFRRLCILKGIYPREPLGRVPGKKKGQSFYHIKDIKAIAHEPILEKFREFRAFMKKVRTATCEVFVSLIFCFLQVRRAAGRNEVDEAARKNSLLPTYTVHHLVKERYPRFSDALSDMDDALTLIYLFAALPANNGIKPSQIAKAKALAASWAAYCATTASLTKCFISVKGVYMEALVHGSSVRWLQPHAFTQHVPEDVDYRVLQTFMEFYETLLNFVLFRLYHEIGVRYPIGAANLEKVGTVTAVLQANLKALTLAFSSSQGGVSAVVTKTVQNQSTRGDNKAASKRKKQGKQIVKAVDAALNKLVSDDDSDGSDDERDALVDVVSPLHAALENAIESEERVLASDDTESAKERRHLFRGLVFFLSREVPRGYIELICLAFGGKVGWDGEESPLSMTDSSITHHISDRPQLPSSYESLPKSREYIQPQWVLDSCNFLVTLPVTKYAVGVTLPPHLSPWVDNKEERYAPAYTEEIARIKRGEPSEDSDMLSHAVGFTESEKLASVDDTNEAKIKEFVVEEEEEDQDSAKATNRRKKKRKKEEEEAQSLAKSMMSRKALHLYGRMQHGLAEKQAKVDSLHKRRAELESAKGKDSAGRTVVKQKIERLKKERKSVEESYQKTGGSMKRKRAKR